MVFGIGKSGKSKSGKSKKSGSQDPQQQAPPVHPSPQQQAPPVHPSPQQHGYLVHPSAQQHSYPIHPTPQNPGDDFMVSLLNFGITASPQPPVYTYGTPGGGSQFQPYTTPTGTTPRQGMHDEGYNPDVVQNLFNTPGGGSTPASDGGSSHVPFTQLSSEDASPRRSSATRKCKASDASGSGTEKPKRARSTYTEAESKLIAECWADVSQDAAIGTNQTELMFWSRVHDRYTANMRAGMKDHTPEQIRRHWERLLKECGHFNGIYTNLMNSAGSGETEPSVRREAYERYAGQYNITHGFKWWDIYEVLKELPKFRRGMNKALQQRSVRPRLSTDADYSSGPEPIDLTDDQAPPQRPMGNRKTKEANKGKGKGKAKAGASSGQLPEEAEGYINMGNGKILAHMWTLYLQPGISKKQKSKLWKTINELKKQMGLIQEDESEPDE